MLEEQANLFPSLIVPTILIAMDKVESMPINTCRDVFNGRGFPLWVPVFIRASPLRDLGCLLFTIPVLLTYWRVHARGFPQRGSFSLFAHLRCPPLAL